MSISRGKRPLPQSAYLLPERRLVVTRINPDTMWGDRNWRFRGARKDVWIDWATDLTEDQWESIEWQRLINLGRRLVLAELEGVVAPPEDLKTIENKRGPLLYFLRWMLRNDYYDLSEISVQACNYYRDDLRADKIDDVDPDESISQSRLAIYLDVPIRFFRHAVVFKAFPEMFPEAHPYAGEPAQSLAGSLVASVTKHIPRVPVEVQNAVLPMARKWIWEHSPDILLLQKKFVAARAAGSHHVGNSYMYYTDKALLAFRFDLDGTLHVPWRAPLQAKVTVKRDVQGKEKVKSAGPSSQFKFLQTDLRDACVSTALGLAGMRISDLAALQVEPRGADGLPYCLVRKRSVTGLYELYFARGKAVKGGKDDDEPDEEWLVGSHPVGSNALPDAAKAILVLDELFAPWRELAQSNSLIVSLGKGRGPPRAVREQPEVMLESLRTGQISFVANHVTLPPDYADWVLSTHQWRKAYAEDIITINPDLVPAVQEQFKQISQAVLEAAYVGNTPYFNRLLAEQREHSTGDAMYAIVKGGSIAVGATEADIRLLSENLGQLLGDYPTEKKQKGALRRLCAEEGVSLWGQAYGDCLFRAAASRCHQREHGEFDPYARRPLTAHVCSELCVTCSNLIISQRHRSYWTNKHDENLRALGTAEAEGDTAFALLCRDRVRIARTILDRLDAAREDSVKRRPK